MKLEERIHPQFCRRYAGPSEIHSMCGKRLTILSSQAQEQVQQVLEDRCRSLTAPCGLNLRQYGSRGKTNQNQSSIDCNRAKNHPDRAKRIGFMSCRGEYGARKYGEVASNPRHYVAPRQQRCAWEKRWYVAQPQGTKRSGMCRAETTRVPTNIVAEATNLGCPGQSRRVIIFWGVKAMELLEPRLHSHPHRYKRTNLILALKQRRNR